MKASGKGISLNQLHTLDQLLARSFETIEGRFERRTEVSGLPTGLDDLDRLTSGLHGGDLVVVAGRPSSGKSALVRGIAQYVATELDHPALTVDAVSHAARVIERILASEARIDLFKIRNGRLGDDDWAAMSTTTERLAASPLNVLTGPEITTEAIIEHARDIDDLALVTVDPLPIVADADRDDDAARWDTMARAVAAMKRLALELEIPVIVTATVGRGPENRTDKRPRLDDLAESSALEYDADLVLMLYRDEVYDFDTPERGVVELLALKHRDGPTGIIKLAFLDHFTKFANLPRTAIGTGKGHGG